MRGLDPPCHDAAPSVHDVAIVGAYNTRQARVLEQPETAVLLDAMRGALRSAPSRSPTSTAST